MPRPTRAKTLEEVEEEVEALGLTNETAAAIVRLANTLKRVRKLRAEHIELLTPGRRIHPPSPLAQPVWKQADIEEAPRPDQGAEADNSEAADAGPSEPPHLNSPDDVIPCNMGPTALADVIPRVGDISLSQEHLSSSEAPIAAPPLDEDEKDIDLSEKDSSKA